MVMATESAQVKDASAQGVVTRGVQDVPPGYKRTELGLIPEDWSVARLGTLGATLSGGTPRRSDARFWGGDIPWVSSKDMKVTRLRDSIDHVTQLAIGNGTRLVQPGTILMVVRGMSLAHSFPVAIVERPAAFNQDLKAFVPEATYSGEFILRWLEANEARILLLATEATHGTKRLPTDDLLGSSVPVPPGHEQRAIAEALSDVDGLLGALEALIAKKRAIKQAAMQQLLTGKTRLPGFSRKWQVEPLSSLLVDGPKNGYSGSGGPDARGTPTLRLSATTSGTLILDETTLKRLSETISSGSDLFLKPGDVLVQRSNTLDLVGTTAFYDGPPAVYVYPDLLMRLRFRSDTTARWFTNYANSPYGREFFVRAAAGSTASMPKLSGSALRTMPLRLPPPPEQAAIVEMLTDMDAEVTALERKRSKIRGLKQGMMQQLLTGRVRLIQPGAV